MKEPDRDSSILKQFFVKIDTSLIFIQKILLYLLFFTLLRLESLSK